MELFVSICLIIVGVMVGLLGLKLFKVLLPVAGLIVGAVVGFTGIQGIFGTGVTSTTVAILVACVFGLVLAVLSYAFFDIALVVLMGMAFSSIFALFGIALGLSGNGFIVFLLSVAGFIVGVLAATSSALHSEEVVTFVTAFLGAGLILGGVFILGSGVSMADFQANGVIPTVAERASNSFWWVFVWVAGAVLMRYVQIRMLFLEIFPEELGYKPQTDIKA